MLHPMQQLEAQGFEVTYLQPDETGFVSVEALKAALRPDTILVSIMMVNNESGAVMPIADMVRATRRLAPLALFHTDAVQGFLKVPFKAKTLGADLISISGHKVHGPKGVGALYIKPGSGRCPRSSTAADRRAISAPGRKTYRGSAGLARQWPRRTRRRTSPKWRGCAIWRGRFCRRFRDSC